MGTTIKMEMVTASAAANDHSRVTSHDGSGWDRAGRHGSEGNYSAFAYMSSRSKNSSSSDPDIRLNADRTEAQVKTRGAEIVIACAEIGTLRKANSISNLYKGEIVNPCVLRQPTSFPPESAGELHEDRV